MTELLIITVALLVGVPVVLLGIGRLVAKFTSWRPRFLGFPTDKDPRA